MAKKMCGKFERKVEFNSDDYIMLLASTGQPSFYPEPNSDNEKKDNNNKNEDDKNKIIDDSSPVQSNGGDEEEEEVEEKIFDFH